MSTCQCSCGQRLHEAGALLRGRAVPAVQDTRTGQHTVHARRAGGDHVLVDHHEAQPPVALQRKALMKDEDGSLLLGCEPVIARHERVVLIDLAVALSPVEELASSDAEPADESLGR
jgi:hypothetical protein